MRDTPNITVPPEVAELVERFDRNRADYASGAYNEARLRQEFLNPFFEALGWDMQNREGYAEAYKDVIHEDAIKVGGDSKAPDYCFRIGGTRKFFVEAKKPSVNVRDDCSPAYQLRRYAWSAKLPLSILTNFDEFAVYDCRVKPVHTDKASTARTMHLTYKDYAAQWDSIASIFSREAILKGSFDKYAESGRAKRGTAEVDQAFLREIESWRDVLARNLALRNPALTSRELNFAVQRIIDRIIFLRICEDRHYEDYGSLRVLLNGTRVYPRLTDAFRAADDRYNSGLFHFHRETARAEGPDELTLALEIDDKPLKDIIKTLYYPDSPYEFSVLPADILGQVYEQFLGKVIRLTPGHQAKVEDKPEVKKAGGVYYTPTYIVDYIVKNTVGKLVEGKTPKQVEKLRVLDPACGSGSFLIGAYQYFMDWHRDWYMANDPAKWAKARDARLYQAERGEWRLTNAERKRILLNNIYGVDIDSQAVEVTKLSLLLKILEGGAQLAMGGERMLPDLGGNIKCGNSLIGPDFYAGQQMTLLDDEERLRVNVFDWESEFPEIMKSGGFDAVIGNPPYIFGEYHDQMTKAHLQSEYTCAKEQFDTYWLFIERGLVLTRKCGIFSMIVPDALLARDQGKAVRANLLNSGLDRVYHCGPVFRAAVSAVVFTVLMGEVSDFVVSEVRRGFSPVQEHACLRSRFQADLKKRLLVHASDAEALILEKLEQSGKTMSDMLIEPISRGEETGKARGVTRDGIPILVGEDVSRYWVREPSRFVPQVEKPSQNYTAPKIVVVKTGATCVAALDAVGHVTMQSVYNLRVSNTPDLLQALLGILNSRVVRFFIAKTFTAYKLLFPQMNQATVESIPVPNATEGKGAPLARSVDQMLALHKQLAEARLEQDKTAIQRQIDATDRQIDALVYELYGLTDEEIAIVEGRQDRPPCPPEGGP